MSEGMKCIGFEIKNERKNERKLNRERWLEWEYV